MPILPSRTLKFAAWTKERVANTCVCFTRKQEEEEVYEPPPTFLSDPQGGIDRIFNLRKAELYRVVGKERGMHIYQESIRQFDYAVVNAEADEEDAQMLRRSLEASEEDVAVGGSWSIRLGDSMLSEWERLIRSSTTILVLVSQALFHDRLPVSTAMAALLDENIATIVPVYLEEIPSNTIPRELSMLMLRTGLDLYHLGIEGTVNELARHTSVTTRYARELDKLDYWLRFIRKVEGTGVNPASLARHRGSRRSIRDLGNVILEFLRLKRFMDLSRRVGTRNSAISEPTFTTRTEFTIESTIENSLEIE